MWWLRRSQNEALNPARLRERLAREKKNAGCRPTNDREANDTDKPSPGRTEQHLLGRSSSPLRPRISSRRNEPLRHHLPTRHWMRCSGRFSTEGRNTAARGSPESSVSDGRGWARLQGELRGNGCGGAPSEAAANPLTKNVWDELVVLSRLVRSHWLKLEAMGQCAELRRYAC